MVPRRSVPVAHSGPPTSICIPLASRVLYRRAEGQLLDAQLQAEAQEPTLAKHTSNVAKLVSQIDSTAYALVTNDDIERAEQAKKATRDQWDLSIYGYL